MKLRSAHFEYKPFFRTELALNHLVLLKLQIATEGEKRNSSQLFDVKRSEPAQNVSSKN